MDNLSIDRGSGYLVSTHYPRSPDLTAIYNPTVLPTPRKAKFKKPPKKKFRLKLRFSGSDLVKQERVKIERDHKPVIPRYLAKKENPIYIKPEKQLKREEWNVQDDFADPLYTPNQDEFNVQSSDDELYFQDEAVLQQKKVNSQKTKKKRSKVRKPRRRYKRRILSDSEKLQASRRRRTCLVKKPKSQYLGVSWCNTKNTWVARVWHPTERKLIWAGYHSNERACALAVNEKCLDLQIPLKNPHVMTNDGAASETTQLP